MPVAIGGGSFAGAATVAARLIGEGAEALISFGLAGGLDPTLPPGALAIPRMIQVAGSDLACDPALLARLNGPTVARLLGATTIAVDPDQKQLLFRTTGAAAIDLESGAVAQAAADAGLPFAALRAICDPAGRTLPRAALTALDDAGTIRPGRLAAALLARPADLPALLALARDAALARRSLQHHLRDIATLRPPATGATR